jgi:Holliday junction resolvase RusA-like endonuclease
MGLPEAIAAALENERKSGKEPKQVLQSIIDQELAKPAVNVLGVTQNAQTGKDGYEFTLPVPPLLNHAHRIVEGKYIKSAQGRAYIELVSDSLIGQSITPLVGHLSLEMKVYRARKAGDVDAYNKILQDSLNGICWHDDGQIKRLVVEIDDDKVNPRVEVTIRRIEK